MPPPFPLTPTSSDGDPFCTQELCASEDISLNPATGQSIGTSSDWTYQSTSPTPLTSTSFPVTPTSSDGDPFCTQEFCDYEDIYRTRFFRVVTLGGGSVSLNPNRDPTDSIRDTDGTVYATHRWFGSSTACVGPVVTKVSSSSLNAAVVWTKQYKCADGLILFANAHIKFDIYGNLWLIYNTCSGNGTATTAGTTTLDTYDYNVHFVRISKTTGNILFSKSFKVLIKDSGYFARDLEQVIQDPSGNWYIASSHAIGDNTWKNGSTIQIGWIIKLNYSLDVQWGARWTGNTYIFNYSTGRSERQGDAYTNFLAMHYSNNSIYISSRVAQSPGVAPTFLKLNATTGAFIQWPYTTFTGESGFPAYSQRNVLCTRGCLGSDSSLNIYAVCGTVAGYSVGIIVLKFSATGNIIWQKDFFVNDDFGSAYLNQLGQLQLLITKGDRIFISANRTATLDFSGRTYAYILEITTEGAVLSTRRYRNSAAVYSVLNQLATYTYSPETLLLKFDSGDHVDTTQEVELFSISNTDYPSQSRTMISLTNSPSIPFTGVTETKTLPRLNTWGSVQSEFAAYSTSFTATAPELPTVLFDVAQIRD